MHATTRSLLLVTATLVLTGCAAPGSSKWTGTWKADGVDYGGDLHCTVQPVDDENYKATFTGYCNRQFLYEIQMKGRKDGQKIIFEGDADLGEKDGGLYHWTGYIHDDQFVGQYASTGRKKGRFKLARQ